jgi:hypothetical protein
MELSRRILHAHTHFYQQAKCPHCWDVGHRGDARPGSQFALVMIVLGVVLFAYMARDVARGRRSRV